MGGIHILKALVEACLNSPGVLVLEYYFELFPSNTTNTYVCMPCTPLVCFAVGVAAGVAGLVDDFDGQHGSDCDVWRSVLKALIKARLNSSGLFSGQRFPNVLVPKYYV